MIEFRELTDEETISFRLWARMHYQPGTEVNSAWHPATRKECAKMNEEARLINLNMELVR